MELLAGNLYHNIPDNLPEETFDELLKSDSVTIERIVSNGHRSSEGSWYDQEKNEYVVLVKGEAEIRFEYNDERVKMKAGSFLNIPSHTRHRVEWTSDVDKTIWLAIHY